VGDLLANLHWHDLLSEITYEFVQDVPGFPPFYGKITLSISTPPDGKAEMLAAEVLEQVR